ncbi:MAG: LysM peptidoglycan-binding domain-containing protein [Bacteroidetes bacterium]|nr:LysM peptidoglycan-binding domain-containing protein [Bacteroidota bacterium]
MMILLKHKSLWQTPISGVVKMLCLALILFSANTSYAQVEIEEGKETEVEPDNIAIDDTTVAVQEVEEVFDSTFNYTTMESIVCDPNLIRAGLLYDVQSNTVVWQKEMNYSFPIASVTKIMVALLTIEDIQAGKLSWNDVITTTSYKYVGRRRHKKKVYFHNEYSLRDMLKMVMIESNNYASNLVATHAGKGNLSTFIDRMNNKAVYLGMIKTMYTNPSGLPASYRELDNRSSPHDLLLLAKYAINNKPLMEIANMGYAEVSNGTSRYTIRNHNALVRDFLNEVEGVKTGFTTRAGFCLVATSIRYNHRLIAIALGARSSFSRNAFVSDMMSSYYVHIGLGPMGIKLSDEVLAAVRPNLDNSKFNYPATRINPYFIPDPNDIAAKTAVTYQSVFVQAKKVHKIKPGETLSGIADKYNVTIAQLKTWNHIKSNTIRSGQTLAIITKIKKQIPVMESNPALKKIDIPNENAVASQRKKENNSAADKNSATAKKGDIKTNKGADTSTKATAAKTEVKKYYRVQKGEGLITIARKNNCTVEQLMDWNKLNDKNITKDKVLIIYDSISVDAELANQNKANVDSDKTVADVKIINAKNKAVSKPVLKGKYVYYTVQPGDTLWTIAQKYAGVTVKQIKKVNGIQNHKSLLPGTKVKVPIT